MISKDSAGTYGGHNDSLRRSMSGPEKWISG